MFDWDGEELANIIWGKAGENEDHIVPYPDETYAKPPWPDLSLSNATKLDLERTDKKAQVDNGSQNFDNRPEDKGDFVNYGWANVGSFDDLDRILSNNDLGYGNANISSIESPSLHLGDLSSGCEHIEAKLEFVKDDSQTNNHLCYSTEGVNTNVEKMECSGGKYEKSASNIVRRIPTLVYPIRAVNAAVPGEIGIRIGKIGEQRKSLGCENTKGQRCDPWFSLGNQGKELRRRYTRHMKISSSKARNQQTESSPYNHFVPSHCGYNIMGNQHFHTCEEQRSPCGNSSLVPVSMTPQEKIEKLRRRHQMRALLAIRKQQREFRHQSLSNNHSNSTRCLNESQIDESLSTFMSLEKSDLDTRPMMMNASSLEDTVLHRLQNLDIQRRLCIRESLFRLAQNALQRQYAEPNAVTSSARTPNGETKTNPIDRAVAHLLFHRPPELCGELMQSLESPSSGSTGAHEGSSRGLSIL